MLSVPGIGQPHPFISCLSSGSWSHLFHSSASRQVCPHPSPHPPLSLNHQNHPPKRQMPSVHPPQDPLSVSNASSIPGRFLSPPSPTSSTETRTTACGPPALSVNVAPPSKSHVHSLPACRKPRRSCSQLPRTAGQGAVLFSEPITASSNPPGQPCFTALCYDTSFLFLFPPLVGEPPGGRGLCPPKLNSWLRAALGQLLWKEYISDSQSVVPASPGNLPQIQISCPSPDLSQTPEVGPRLHKPSR